MKRSTIILAVVMLILVGVTVATCYRYNKKNEPTSKQEICKLQTGMRELWEDHAKWTREVIIGIVNDVPGTPQAVARLLNNQDAIGAAIAPYYGKDKGDKLGALLKEHILIAADVINDAKYHNTEKLAKDNAKWYANATEIAKFLSSINNNLDYADMKYMMDYHLKYTTAEVLSRVDKNYDKNVKDSDKVTYELREMSDMITMGIVKQFPDKFVCDEKDSKNGGY